MKSNKPIIEITKNYVSINIISSIIYVIFYDFIYHNYITALFENPYNEMDANKYFIYLLLSVAPIVFFKGLKNIASIFSIFVYIFAYIPFIETLSVGNYDYSYNDYRLVFFISMCVFFITDNIRLYTIPFNGKKQIEYKTFRKISLLCLILILILNINNLHFTNFITSKKELYELRSELSVVGGTPILYLLYWLKNAILPLILVSSLILHDKTYVFISFIGCLAIFMIDQQKITFVAPFAIVGLYYIYKKNKLIIKNFYHILIMGTLILVPAICYVLMYQSDIAYEIAAIIIMRTQCIEGMELDIYFNWFGHSGDNPYTYYTHINFIDFFFNAYPYDTSIGHVVTHQGANANGMFWLMDGIAAAGLIGCIIISFIFTLFKSFFNGISESCDISIFAIIALFSMSMAMNVSLFTAFFSCGLLAFYLIFAFVDLRFLNSKSQRRIIRLKKKKIS